MHNDIYLSIIYIYIFYHFMIFIYYQSDSVLIQLCYQLASLCQSPTDAFFLLLAADHICLFIRSKIGRCVVAFLQANIINWVAWYGAIECTWEGQCCRRFIAHCDGHATIMMTSSNGNIFRVTGHLSPVNSPHKGQ